MKRSITLLLILTLFVCQANAQVEKFEVYQTGTKISFYPNACGVEIPEAEGKISFCDAANNLGVVERSYGLNSQLVRKIVPNYFNNDEVFITDLGYSIRKEDGSWQNIPRIAIPTTDLSNAVVSEDAIVTPDGKLLFGVSGNSTDDLVYLDLVTLNFETFDLVSNNEIPAQFAFDEASGKTYIFTRDVTQVKVYSLIDDILTAEGALPGIPSQIGNWRLTLIDNAFLYVAGDNGLYQYHLDDLILEQLYNTNELPSDFIQDMTIDTQGRLWIAYGFSGNSGLARFTPTTEAFEFFTIEDPGNGNMPFLNIAIDSEGLIWAVPMTSDPIFTLDPNDTNPIWTTIPFSDFDTLGLEISFRPNSVDVFNNTIYAVGTNGVQTPRAFEILKFQNDTWSGITDDEPGNISSAFAYKGNLNNFQMVVRGTDGGIWWANTEDEILTYLSDDRITGVYDFPLDEDELILDPNGNPMGIDGSDVYRYNAPLIQEISDQTLGFGPDYITTFEDEVWIFDRQPDVLHIYLNDNEVATHTLTNYDSNNPISADSFGNVFYTEDDEDNNQLIINKLDRTTDTEETITHTYSTDPFPNNSGDGKYQQLAFQDGKMAFISQEIIFLYDNGTVTEVALHDLFGLPEGLTISSATLDDDGNIILLIASSRIGRIFDPFGSVNSELYPVLAGSDELLPEFNLGLAKTITLDDQGGIWIQGQGHWIRTTLTSIVPAPANFESKRIKGQVYFDYNDDGVFDADEAYKNQRIALVKDGNSVIRYTNSRADGTFEFLYNGEGDYTLTLLGSDPRIFTDDLVRAFNVSDLEVDTDLGIFRLRTRYIDGLLVKSSEKQGAWGFNREGFENTFTTAIGNISSSKTFTNLNFQFLYQNEDDNSDNVLPEIEEINVYRVNSLDNIPVIYNTVIFPRSHNWQINGSLSNYSINTLSTSPQIQVAEDVVTVDFNIDAISPNDMIVVEVKTGLFAPEQNGDIIQFGLSFFGGDNLNDDGSPLTIPLIPRPSDVPQLRFPEDVSPFVNPNNPYVDPYISPGSIYSPRPSSTRIASSYDPNDKLVTPGLPDVLNEIDVDTPYLTYTIRFENEGNFSAKDIYILDALDTNLDLNSIQLIEASHDVIIDQLEVNGETNLRFFFKDIFLDFTANDPQASQGYVKFAVRPLNDIPLNTIVENTARIYFDQNPPIITNTTQHQFVELALSNSDFIISEIKVFPNPVNEGLSIKLPVNDDYTVQIFDLNGRELSKSTFKHTNQIELLLDFLSDGNYLLKVTGSVSNSSVKIIKN